MNRKNYFWKLPSTELSLGERTLIMGVLNVTPDSFSDGGRYSDPDTAYARALELEEQGADIIDIGAESTRPDSKRVSAEEEWRRLLPVLKLLRDKLSVPLSLDTYKSETAERALQYGVSIFNDPSGLTFDANLAKVAAEHNAGLILNHMRGTPETWGKLPPLPDVMGSVAKDLEATVSRARRAGVEKNRIVVDPGLGFGKRREQNSEILAHLERLAALDYPILAGPSRKSFLSHGALAGAGEGETAYATAAAVTAAVLHGAHIVRVHDVKAMRSAARIADEILHVAGAYRAAQDAAEERASPRPRPRGEGQPGREEKTGGPARPPLLRRVVPIPAEPVKPADRAEPVKPPERPVFRRPAADRPARPMRPRDRDKSERPDESRGSDDRRGGDTRGGERPRSFRSGGDRTQGDRPPRSGPPRRGPQGSRPPRSGPPGGSPPRSGPPWGAGPRPPGDRPPRPFRKRP
jgi:dihydropteroate synthase